MSDLHFDLFVVGGGSGGVRCARISATLGARVGIAEGRFWGGTCVNVGCVPKKFMVMAAEYRGTFEDARGFGWDMKIGAHDWKKLIAANSAEVSRLSSTYEHLLADTGATLFEANARFINARTLDVGGKLVTADRIVIATGAHPTRLDIPGAEYAIVSDDIFVNAERPRRVAIIGSGYIAVEFAGIFAGLGSDVHLIYRQSLPIRGFDDDIRVALAESLATAGISLHPNTTPMAIAALGDARTVSLSSGVTIEVDTVLFATGRVPNTSSLNLESAGIRVTPSGAIIIDAHLATSTPHIFAIGDVTDRLNLTPAATAEGHALADSLFGNHPRTISLENVPTAIFSIPPIGTVGLTEQEAAARGSVKVFISKFTPMRHAISGRLRKSIIKLVVDTASDRVLGIHMLGEDAPEIVQGLAVAFTAGATKADFDHTIGIHPTAAEEFVTLRTETKRVKF